MNFKDVFDINFEKLLECNRFEFVKFLSVKCDQWNGDEQDFEIK